MDRDFENKIQSLGKEVFANTKELLNDEEIEKLILHYGYTFFQAQAIKMFRNASTVSEEIEALKLLKKVYRI